MNSIKSIIYLFCLVTLMGAPIYQSTKPELRQYPGDGFPKFR